MWDSGCRDWDRGSGGERITLGGCGARYCVKRGGRRSGNCRDECGRVASLDLSSGGRGSLRRLEDHRVGLILS